MVILTFKTKPQSLSHLHSFIARALKERECTLKGSVAWERKRHSMHKYSQRYVQIFNFMELQAVIKRNVDDISTSLITCKYCVCVGKGLVQCLLANKSYVMRSQPYWSNNKKIHIISWCQFLCVCIFACLYVPCAKRENRKKYNAENFCQITNHRKKKRREKNRKQEKSKTAHSWDIRTSSFFRWKS